MTKARLYWHIFVTEKTSAIVTEQLQFLKRQVYPVTAVVTWEEVYDFAVNPILNQLAESKIVDVVKKSLAKEFEFDTIKILFLEAKDYEFIGYFHTKGAVNEQPQTHLWRNLMNFYTIQMAETAVDYLKDETDVIGAFGSHGLEGQKPYVAGNFWWAKSIYIQQLPFPVLLPHHTRYDCELWIGLGSGKIVTHFDYLEMLCAPISGIAEKYDTDKKIHGYMPFYELYLSPFRYSRGMLLEIGVYQGESLKLWQEALPEFIIEGMDVKEKSDTFAKVHVGDQADRVFLSMLPDYDIVIDDGGHRSKQQIISLVSKIQNTSLYVIEDLHTSCPDLYANYHEAGEITCLDYLRQYPNLKPDYISDAEHKRLECKRIYIIYP